MADDRDAVRRAAPTAGGVLWDGGETVSVHSQPGARIRNIGRNPKVTLNFRGDANGGDVVVLSGTAEVDQSASRGWFHLMGIDRRSAGVLAWAWRACDWAS